MAQHLTSQQLDELRTMLNEERDRLRSRRGRLPDEAVIDEVRDEPDRASAEERLGLELTVGAHERAHLAEVDAALARMDAGTYGICEETGEPIPFARLRTEPTTRYTVEAQEMREQERERDRKLSAEEGETPSY